MVSKKEQFVVLDVGGVGYRVFVAPQTAQEVGEVGQTLTMFCHTHVREDAHDLFGFAREADLAFFEKLIMVNGVGPRSALAVMGVAPTEQLIAAINEGRSELLTRASGVGRKTGERIILELKGKLPMLASAETVQQMELDAELEEVLLGLGYTRSSVRGVLKKVDQSSIGLENKLKAALKLLKK